MEDLITTPSTPTPMRAFKRDMYCWVCHMEGALIKCKICPRIFHRNCANQLSQPAQNYFPLIFDYEEPNPDILKACPECQMSIRTTYASMKNVPPEEFRLICMSISRNLRDGYFWPNPFYKLEDEKTPKGFIGYKDVVAKMVDISELENLAYNNYFSSLEGLLGETKWILHNTIITHGRCSKEADCAKDLLDMCEVEMMAADLCPECYLKEQDREKDPNWFIKPCVRQPHLPGWAKTPQNPYWPVKIMRWLPGDDSVTVWSFVDHRRFDIPLVKCFIYSRHPPQSDSHRGVRAAECRHAQDEMKLYITQLEKLSTVIIPQQASNSLSSYGSIDNAVNFMFPDLQISKDSLKIEDALKTEDVDIDTENNVFQ